MDVPKELTNLEYLYCSNTSVSIIPKELAKLKSLYISHTYVTSIPEELICLNKLYFIFTNVKDIPKKLINLTNLCVGTEHNIAIIVRQKKIKNGFIKYVKLWKIYKLFKTLWQIAEYYTKKKYHPNNIHKYINLD
jgi:hypothetical protein